MIFTLRTFTIVHVIISLIGIASGLIVLFGLLTGRRLDRWTALFLLSTVATSVTGFLFPYHGFTPGIGLGIISMVLLAVAIAARYGLKLAGAWRWIYAVTAIMSLYLNVFVLVAQLFQKVPALKAVAPTETELPFAIAQLSVLIAFVALTILSVRSFRPVRQV
jgi:hypothetical protein